MSLTRCISLLHEAEAFRGTTPQREQDYAQRCQPNSPRVHRRRRCARNRPWIDRSCGRASEPRRTCGCDDACAGDRCLSGTSEADQRRPAERRIRRGRTRRRAGGPARCTAGLTTSTASPTSRPCWPPGLSRDRAVSARLRTTRFLSAATRTQRPTLGDRSGHHRARWMRSRSRRQIVGGFDWGARTANIMAALWPERVSAWSRSAVI